MKKQKQFEKAKELREAGLTYKMIGEVVAALAGRSEPYSESSMHAWLKHDSYEDHCQAVKEAFSRPNERNNTTEYPTSDFYTAVVLRTLNYKIIRTSGTDRVIFVFEDDGSIPEVVNSYHNGDLNVVAREFINCINEIKTRVHGQ